MRALLPALFLALVNVCAAQEPSFTNHARVGAVNVCAPHEPSFTNHAGIGAVNVCAAQEPSFTNHAGFVLSGALSAFSGTAVTIGKERVPLTIFPEREQRRICALAGQPRVPRDVRLAIAGCREAAERSRERARQGIIKEEVARIRQEKADQALSAYLKKRLADGTLLEEEYQSLAR